jgi:hypothetical protein
MAHEDNRAGSGEQLPRLVIGRSGRGDEREEREKQKCKPAIHYDPPIA